MNLLEPSGSIYDLNDALSHFNYALRRNERVTSRTDIAQTWFNGLNKLQTGWARNQSGQQLGEVKAFQTMIARCLSAQGKTLFLQSAELANLVTLIPRIMNHDVLRRKNYNPYIPIEQEIVKEATTVHQKLVNAYRDLDTCNEESTERIIKRAAELLYIVRSNIAHGEKTRYGPDTEKTKRDEQVCASIVPLQGLLCDLLLGQPTTKLISYGTLAPRQPNHSVISELKGHWVDCLIHGLIKQRDDLLQFSWDPAAPELKVSMFISEDLPNSWAQIDRFEGDRYQRQLVPAKTSLGIEIGYAYNAIE